MVTKYLKFFNTYNDYNTYITGQDVKLPNVCYCEDIKEVHYNPAERRLVATFNVTNTSNAIAIMGSSATSSFSEIEIDGVLQPNVVNSYTFATAGEHTIKYTLAAPTSIGRSAFQSCSGLTSITIPNGVTRIETNAFLRCGQLTSVTIGTGITDIQGQAFHECISLSSVTIKAISPPTLGVYVFSNNASGRKIFLPIDSVNSYKRSFSGYENDIKPIISNND